jgi:hypothetical protein
MVVVLHQKEERKEKAMTLPQLFNGDTGCHLCFISLKGYSTKTGY